MHVGRPNIGNADTFLDYAKEILASRWLSNNGAFVQKFERRLEKNLGVKHVIVTCNATIAMQVLLSVALERSGEIIVPDFTFIATAHAVTNSGHQLVVADVDRATHCLSPASVKNLLSEKTVAAIGVHLWANHCFVDEFEKISRDHNIPIFYDAAHAFGAKYKGKSIGGFGAAEVFSFHATKIFNTFEGGAITTNDDALAHRLREFINFGFTDRDDVIGLGTNAKMSEISAAMGLVNLDSLPGFIDESKKKFEYYARLTADFDGLDILLPLEGVSSNYHYVVFNVDPVKLKKSRDQIADMLASHDVLARRYFSPGMSRSLPHKQARKGDLGVSQSLCETTLVLPGGPSVSMAECAWIIELIDIFCRRDSK